MFDCIKMDFWLKHIYVGKELSMIFREKKYGDISFRSMNLGQMSEFVVISLISKWGVSV